MQLTKLQVKTSHPLIIECSTTCHTYKRFALWRWWESNPRPNKIQLHFNELLRNRGRTRTCTALLIGFASFAQYSRLVLALFFAIRYTSA